MANLLWWALCNSEGWLSFFFYFLFLLGMLVKTKRGTRAQKTLSKPGNDKRRDFTQTETKINTESDRKRKQGAEKKLGSLDGNQGVSCFLYMDVCLGHHGPPPLQLWERSGQAPGLLRQWTKGSLNWLIWFACRVTAYMLYSNTASWSAQPGFSSSFLPLCTTLHLSFPFNVVIKPHFDVILWNVFPIPKPGFREGLFQL